MHPIYCEQARHWCHVGKPFFSYQYFKWLKTVIWKETLKSCNMVRGCTQYKEKSMFVLPDWPSACFITISDKFFWNACWKILLLYLCIFAMEPRKICQIHFVKNQTDPQTDRCACLLF